MMPPPRKRRKARNFLAVPKRSHDLRPRWDSDSGELWVGKTLVKVLDEKAVWQRLVLDAFQELGWPPEIDDPLPHGKVPPKRRVHNTISDLNRHLRELLIHFGGNGTGTGFRWWFDQEVNK